MTHRHGPRNLIGPVRMLPCSLAIRGTSRPALEQGSNHILLSTRRTNYYLAASMHKSATIDQSGNAYPRVTHISRRRIAQAYELDHGNGIPQLNRSMLRRGAPLLQHRGVSMHEDCRKQTGNKTQQAHCVNRTATCDRQRPTRYSHLFTQPTMPNVQRTLT